MKLRDVKFIRTALVFGIATFIACNGKSSPVGPSATKYQLTVAAQTGGTITAPSNSALSVVPGTSTIIKAHANAGYAFARWIVAQGIAVVGYLNSPVTTVTIDSGSDTVTAQFITVQSALGNINVSAFQKEQGANFSYYKGSWTSMPDFSSLTPDSSGPCDSLDVAAFAHQAHNFGVVFDGYFAAPFDGNYVFYLASSDGSQLLLNDSLIINNDGVHVSPVQESTTVALTQGTYLIGIRYFNASSVPSLNVSYACPDIGLSEATISDQSLSRPYTGPVPKIIVNTPAGGEIYHIGDTIHVTWTYKNPRGQVFAELSVNGGLSFENISLVAFPGNVTSYNWQIPPGADSLVTQSAMIRVEEYPPYNLSALSKPFSIVAAK